MSGPAQAAVALEGLNALSHRSSHPKPKGHEVIVVAGAVAGGGTESPATLWAVLGIQDPSLQDCRACWSGSQISTWTRGGGPGPENPLVCVTGGGHSIPIRCQSINGLASLPPSPRSLQVAPSPQPL